MNLKSRIFRIVPCAVCGYSFSDRHHVYPAAQLTPKFNRVTISLCPNHHRYANMVQTFLIASLSSEEIHTFADKYFDSEFNGKVLDVLIQRYKEIEERIQEHAMEMFETFFGSKVPE